MPYPYATDALGNLRPAGSLDTWDQAKLEASVRPAVALLLGDSIPSGYNATDRRNLGHVGLLTARLHDRFGNGGEGFYGVNDAPDAGAYPPFGLTDRGAWTHFGSLAFNGASAILGSGAIGWPVMRGNELVLWWAPTLGASDGSITLDLVEETVIPLAVGGQTAGAPFSARIGYVGDGYHAVEVSCEAPGCVLLGLEGRNTSGVRFHNMSHFGWVSSHVVVPAWTGAPNPPNSLGEWTIRRFAPHLDLFIWNLGGNDAATGVAPSVVAANMETAFDKARANSPACSLAAFISHPGDGVAIDPVDYTAMAEAVHDVAADYGAAVSDLWARSNFQPIIWPAPGDAVHPDDAGHAWYAESTMALLAETPPQGC